MKITIGSDHRGIELKEKIKASFKDFVWMDAGANGADRTDYPIYAKRVVDSLLNKQADYGILICGSGIGMSIAANRYPKIYAALCWNESVAKVAKSDDGANVLILPADYVSIDDALKIVKAWMDAEFKGGRYQDRLELIDV